MKIARHLPNLFPTGKFGYNIHCNVKLRPARHLNQQFLNYTQLFTSDADHIFYAVSATEQIKLSSQMNRNSKFCSGQVTAGMLSSYFSKTTKYFTTKDYAYQSLKSILERVNNE